MDRLIVVRLMPENIDMRSLPFQMVRFNFNEKRWIEINGADVVLEPPHSWLYIGVSVRSFNSNQLIVSN